MRNITFSADEQLIEAARKRATDDSTTLNEEFRRWLGVYARREDLGLHAKQVVDDLRSRIRTGGKRFTREEMNER